MRKIWINKAKTFDEAQLFDAAYYRNLTGSQRVEIVQVLREMHFKNTGLEFREDGKRLRRVFKVVQQA